VGGGGGGGWGGGGGRGGSVGGVGGGGRGGGGGGKWGWWGGGCGGCWFSFILIWESVAEGVREDLPNIGEGFLREPLHLRGSKKTTQKGCRNFAS